MKLTDWVGVWGGILATILAVLKIFEYRRDRANIKVKIGDNYTKVQPNGAVLTSLIITAINVGRRPVTLSRAGLLMPRNSKQKYLLCADTNPRRLELTEGKSHDYYLDADKLIQENGLPADKYAACVIDETERWYWSHNWLTRLFKLGRIK
ncbi:MAG: hypothetical protein HY811_05685 [Planctomycetes bacterium]|nr:hypothetical protein [Planctomycetota bacterium]